MADDPVVDDDDDSGSGDGGVGCGDSGDGGVDPNPVPGNDGNDGAASCVVDPLRRSVDAAAVTASAPALRGLDGVDERSRSPATSFSLFEYSPERTASWNDATGSATSAVAGDGTSVGVDGERHDVRTPHVLADEARQGGPQCSDNVSHRGSTGRPQPMATLVGYRQLLIRNAQALIGESRQLLAASHCGIAVGATTALVEAAASFSYDEDADTETYN